MSRSKTHQSKEPIPYKNIGFRISGSDLMEFENKIQEANCSYSKFIRNSILDKKIVRIDGLPEMTNQLLRIGNNLNQLSRAVNTYGSLPTQQELQNICQEVAEVKKKLLTVWR